MERKPEGASRPRARAFNFNTVCALLTIAFGALIYLLVPSQVSEPRMIFGQAPSGLHPFMFPRLIGLCIAATGVWYLIVSFSLHEKNELKDLTRSGLFSVGVTIVAFFFVALLFEPLGFVLPSVIAIYLLGLFYGNRDHLLGLAVALLVPLFMYNVFTKGFAVYLPPFPYADLGWM